MRCYLMREGRIGAVEILADGSDAAAIVQAKTLFEEEYKNRYSGFEVWDRARLVHRHSERAPSKASGAKPMIWKTSYDDRTKYRAVQTAFQEARRTRGDAKTFPRGDIREALEAKADKLEALVQSIAGKGTARNKPS